MSRASPAALRYAEAFVESAAQQGSDTLSRSREELKQFSEAIDQVFDLSNLLLNPAVSSDDRVRALDEIMRALGLSDLTARFLHLLAERDRISEVREISTAIDEIADARAGREQAHIQSATELSEATVDQLRRALEVRTGKKIAFDIEVDPSLIGGIRVQVGSLVLDGTIKSELARLRSALESE